MTRSCNRKSCDGECFPISLNPDVAIKCQKCNFISKGGLRGFWRCGKLGLVKMVLIVFGIVTGMSYYQLVTNLGAIKISRRTWTRYIKLVGIVAGEHLERNRRDPSNKFGFAQIDETAFGKRLVTFLLNLNSWTYFLTCLVIR